MQEGASGSSSEQLLPQASWDIYCYVCIQMFSLKEPKACLQTLASKPTSPRRTRSAPNTSGTVLMPLRLIISCSDKKKPTKPNLNKKKQNQKTTIQLLQVMVGKAPSAPCMVWGYILQTVGRVGVPPQPPAVTTAEHKAKPL